MGLSTAATTRVRERMHQDTIDGVNMVVQHLHQETHTTHIRVIKFIIKAAYKVGIDIGHAVVAYYGSPH
jgi:hypothetical protein